VVIVKFKGALSAGSAKKVAKGPGAQAPWVPTLPSTRVCLEGALVLLML
jgi:hypothetical protein